MVWHIKLRIPLWPPTKQNADRNYHRLLSFCVLTQPRPLADLEIRRFQQDRMAAFGKSGRLSTLVSRPRFTVYYIVLECPESPHKRPSSLRMTPSPIVSSQAKRGRWGRTFAALLTGTHFVDGSWPSLAQLIAQMRPVQNCRVFPGRLRFRLTCHATLVFVYRKRSK